MDVYRPIYGRKFTFKVISDSISSDTSPQVNILNAVIPILMHFCANLPLKSLFFLKLDHCKLHKSTCHPTNYDVMNEVKLFLIYGCKCPTLS